MAVSLIGSLEMTSEGRWKVKLFSLVEKLPATRGALIVRWLRRVRERYDWLPTRAKVEINSSLILELEHLEMSRVGSIRGGGWSECPPDPETTGVRFSWVGIPSQRLNRLTFAAVKAYQQLFLNLRISVDAKNAIHCMAAMDLGVEHGLHNRLPSEGWWKQRESLNLQDNFFLVLNRWMVSRAKMELIHLVYILAKHENDILGSTILIT